MKLLCDCTCSLSQVNWHLEYYYLYMADAISLLEKYIHVKWVRSFAGLLQVCIMVQLLPKGSEKSYPTSAHCKRTVHRILVVGGEDEKKAGQCWTEKIWREFGQHCTLNGSTPKNSVCCCWLFKVELKNPNLTWEHNLLILCAELEQYKSCVTDWEARTSIECSSRIGSHYTSCSRTHIFLEQGIVWTEREHKMDIGIPEIPCGSWCSCTWPENWCREYTQNYRVCVLLCRNKSFLPLY